ncbi:MAG: DEAD/DEAH box helicase [Beijerinckiaceae bacterium]
MTFSSVPMPLRQALAERGYEKPTPVQAAVLRPGTEGRDLTVSAQTGSGKTVAYGLALASTLLPESAVLPNAAEPAALIIAPTRELALQVQRELEWLYAPARAIVTACVGGMDPRRERRQLQDGAHIVVGTPGRLRDHLERRALDVSKLKAIVLDEADEMLDLGFREDLEFILQATPEGRRTLLFSATLPKAIVTLAGRYQNDALRIETAGGEDGHADIEYRAIRVLSNERIHAIVNILRQVDSPSTIVFCNTRESVRHLHALLQERGFSAVLLSGELSQNERNHALQALRDRRAQICVATDVAARGLDLPNLGLVIHADLPTDAQVLQHRSGRTGRAGRKGISMLLVPSAATRKAERLLAMAHITARWSGPPSADEIRALDRDRLLLDPILTEAVSEDDLAMARVLLERRPAELLAAALVRAYRARLPEPEDVTDPGTSRPVREERPGTPTKRQKSFDRNDRAQTGGVWFKLSVGRKKNADPRWLLPMLCRRGKITKSDIGVIRIFERETKIEIASHVADQFAINCAGLGADDLRIERAAAPPPGQAEAAAPRKKPHKDRAARA